MHLRLDHFSSPISTILLITDSDGILRGLDFEGNEPRLNRLMQTHYGNHTLNKGPAPASITEALHAYFQGDMDAFNDLPTATNGTPFQRQVWKALREIPASTTISYAQLAKNINHPGSSRAVGAANGSNPIAIVVPCHRVIGANGALTGFAGGLPRKQWLLNHETRFAKIPVATLLSKQVA